MISNIDKYQELAMRTAGGFNEFIEQLNCAVLGMNGEIGEYTDFFKKVLYQGHPFDKEFTVIELGDVMWYVALAADAIGVKMSDILQKNIDKLRIRYPEGFSVERSIHRGKEDENSTC